MNLPKQIPSVASVVASTIAIVLAVLIFKWCTAQAVYIPTAYHPDLTMRGNKLTPDDAGICTKSYRLVLDGNLINPTCCHYPFCVTKRNDGNWYVAN